MINLIKYFQKLLRQSNSIINKENVFHILIVQNRLLFYHLLVIIIFSLIYYYVSKTESGIKDKEKMNTYTDCFYFTTITHFTIGFGDIAPESKILRILVIVQVLIAFILMNR